jgi:hypothetical protein
MPDLRVLGFFDTGALRLRVFASEAEVIANVPGMDIAEGDWRFFKSDGSPLEAVFSEEARHFPDRNAYTNGVYALGPGSGETLGEFLAGLHDRKGELWIDTFEALRQYFE